MPSASTVLVFEYFSGGGCPPGVLHEGLALEALGMLWAVLKDFRNWGAVRTIAAIDNRFEYIVPGLNQNTLPADEVFHALPGEHEKVYLSLLKQCDAVMIIAPETDGILSRMTEQAEAEGKCILGSSSGAATTAGNKAVCSRLFNLANLPTPETRIGTFSSATQIAASMGFPLVAKPLDGIGSEGVCQLDRFADLAKALALIRKSTSLEQILLQSLAVGIHASASILTAEGNGLPLSLNLQLIEPGLPFRYQGSRVPFDHPLGDRALELALRSVGLIPGLNGYVGVDMVLGADLVQLIEINPRLTTSYIGLRQVSRVNLAQAIWECCQNKKLPSKISLEGQVTIKKDDPVTWNLEPG